MDLQNKAECQCKGIVYKADVSNCRTARGLGFFVRLNEQKRLSCPGCFLCGGFYDALHDVSDTWPVEGIEQVEDGKLYRLEFVVDGTDWETGFVDDWHFKLAALDAAEKEGN